MLFFLVISHIFSVYSQVQIYNQYGQFVRKFGANILRQLLLKLFNNISGRARDFLVK